MADPAGARVGGFDSPLAVAVLVVEEEVDFVAVVDVEPGRLGGTPFFAGTASFLTPVLTSFTEPSFTEPSFSFSFSVSVSTSASASDAVPVVSLLESTSGAGSSGTATGAASTSAILKVDIGYQGKKEDCSELLRNAC